MEVREVPTPTPADHEVLVRVRASSVCFGDRRVFRLSRILCPVCISSDLPDEPATIAEGELSWAADIDLA